MYNKIISMLIPFYNLGLVLAINIMMFGITLGIIGIMGKYIGKVFDKNNERFFGLK